MPTLTLSPRNPSIALTQHERAQVRGLTQSPRSHELQLITAFTTSPAGRVFNSRFSARFKKS